MTDLEIINQNESDISQIIKKVKAKIKKQRGNLHRWDYESFHHGWSVQYTCYYCGMVIEERDPTKAEKKCKCRFFNSDFIPTTEHLKKLL